MSTAPSPAFHPALAARLVTLESEGPDGPARAWLYPERGFQLLAYEVTVGGRPVSVVHAPPGPVEPADRRYGNPVLFPAVGVTNGPRADAWDRGGVPLPMPPHGWARNVYWQVERLDRSSLTAVVVPHPGFRLAFPFDFELRMTYRLEREGLVLDTDLVNTGREPFPYALGFHPYLRAPLGSDQGTRGQAVVRAPAGVRLSSADGWRTVARATAPARTLAVTSEELPGSVLLAETGAKALEVEDPAAGLAARVSVEGSEQDFPVWVIWSAAPDSPYVCLEPWTDAPNALNRAGTRTLPAGERHRYRMTLSARRL